MAHYVFDEIEYQNDQTNGKQGFLFKFQGSEVPNNSPHNPNPYYFPDDTFIQIRLEENMGNKEMTIIREDPAAVKYSLFLLWGSMAQMNYVPEMVFPTYFDPNNHGTGLTIVGTDDMRQGDTLALSFNMDQRNVYMKYQKAKDRIYVNLV